MESFHDVRFPVRIAFGATGGPVRRNEIVQLTSGLERRYFEPSDDLAPGRLVLFRWRAHLSAKHAGILLSDDKFIHAYEGSAVMVSALVPQWRQRIAGIFAFPMKRGA